MSQPFTLNRIDQRILDALQQDCRLSNQELADRVGSSASSVWRRIKALQQADVIRGYNLSVNADALGFRETILLQIGLHTHSESNTKRFTELIDTLPQVLECHAVSGEYDYLLKVLATDMRAYYRFIEEHLMSCDFIARTSSTVVMRTIKESRAVPATTS